MTNPKPNELDKLRELHEGAKQKPEPCDCYKCQDVRAAIDILNTPYGSVVPGPDPTANLPGSEAEHSEAAAEALGR